MLLIAIITGDILSKMQAFLWGVKPSIDALGKRMREQGEKKETQKGEGHTERMTE